MEDPFDLNRFVEAQSADYARALAEIASGHKRSHWMWYIFPQFHGLGQSAMSERYSIKTVAEAEAYLDHPLLGPRLIDCFETAFAVQEGSASEIFGSPDDMKFRSCATLFASISPEGSVFHCVLDKYFDGKPDDRTKRLLKAAERK